jgi:hypothetical protein
LVHREARLVGHREQKKSEKQTIREESQKKMEAARYSGA